MASINRIIKKAASSVIPLANRTAHRSYTTSNFCTTLKTNAISTNLFRQVSLTTSIPTHHHFSTRAKKRCQPKKRSDPEDILLSAIKSEIKCAEEEFDDLEVAKAPRDFPFKIVDNAGEGTITLTRDYQGEEIKVTVHMLDLSGDYAEDEDEESQDEEENEEEESQDEEENEDEESQEDENLSLDMVVSVSKTSGPTLEFNVTAEADGITIINLAVRPNASDEDIAYEEPVFEDLDETMREAFHTFLEVRGIKPSMTKFLCDYMVTKEHKNYTGWLKNLKKFFAN